MKRYAYTTGTLGTVQSTKTYSYSTGSWGDLLTAYDGHAISYDGMGNMTSYNGNTYTWQGRQLSKIQGGGNTYTYKYNANGIRTSKTVNGTTTEYFLNGSQILAQKTGDSVMWFAYDSQGQRVGLLYNDTVYYYVYNLQGDVIALARAATGEIVARYAYDAWGNCTVTNASGYTVGTKNPFLYRGYYYDAETGLYYLNSRYYSPEFGRFISADDPGYMGVDGNVLSYNLYAYCLNNPVNRFDVSGHWSVSSLFASLAVAAVAVAVVAVCVASAGTAAPALLAVGGAVLSSGSVVATASTVAVAAATTAVACSAVGAAVAVNERRHSQTYSVYFLEDGSGTIRYVGRVTDTGYDSRMSYHKRTKGLTPAKRVSGLSYEEARGLEEIGMVECHTLNPGQSGNNQIHGISPVNPKGDLYMSNAMSYLENRAEQWLLNLLQ